MFKGNKSIMSKLIIGILPTVIISFLVLALIVTLSAKSIISNEVSMKVETQAELAKIQIVSHLIAHQKLPIGLSKTVESMGIDSLNMNSYIELVKKMPATNADTLGTGIFMADKVGGQYFGPYAYKDGTEIVYTEDYFMDNTNETWYLIGDTQKSVAWSDPFFDPASGITMITAASPIRGIDGRLLGVTTADMDFTNVQKIVSDIKVGENGYAILITQDGSYLGKGTESIAADAQGIFPNISSDNNPSLASLGSEAIKNLSGSSTFEDHQGMNRVFYSQIPETGWIVILTIPEKEILEPVNSIVFKVIIVTVIALILLVFFLSIVSRNITRPLKPLQADIDVISKGDFTRSIQVHSEDEIGQISKSVNMMVIELKHIMKDILITSSNVASTAEQLEASAAQNGQAVEQVATAATEISSSNLQIASVTQELEKVINLVQSLAQNIVNQMGDVNISLTNVNDESKQSKDSIEQLIVVMTQVFDDISDLTAVMTHLSDKSNQIDSIVGTIQGISSQTNLLALNASIEAARAGEAGRGFAVVADEIRKLAEQSSRSANDIASIVSEVSEVTKTANNSTSTVVVSITNGKNALGEVGDAFSRIVSRIDEIDTLIKKADQLAKEISVNSDDANNSATRLTSLTDLSAVEASSIAAATQEQLASVEEQTSATAGLAQIAEELQNKVSIFRV